MHIFDCDRTLESLLSPEITSLIAQIHEFKGRQDYLLNAKDEVLDALVEVSREKSVMASNRIDGVSTPDYRFRDLFDEDAEPRDDDEQAICAYRECFTHVLANYGTMQPTPDSILGLHKMLFAHLPSGGGERKTYKEFASRLDGIVNERASKSDRIRNVIAAAQGAITKREIVEKRPDISVITVSVALKRLCDEGFICKTGNGRNAAYVRIE
ncbi:MAG: hypothetical protein IJ802_00665 [Kiritimatiellae bacterium]|nr:hypothetical protein [Kiritimatiellia bacterium]